MEDPKPETPMKKSTLAGAAAATTLGGVIVGAALFAPTLAGAQEDAPDAPDTEAPAEAPEARPEAGDRIADALQGLIDDGTITEAQADAVVDTLVEARSDARADRPGRRGHFGGGNIAEALGLEPAELREALAGGATLAEVAEEQGVSTDDLVASLVDDVEERVASALEAERIDEDRADEILAGAEERAEALVNGDIEFGRGGGRGFRGGPGAGPSTDADA